MGSALVKLEDRKRFGSDSGAHRPQGAGREEHVPIRSDMDIVGARQRGREIALMLGFQGTDPTLIASAISELARNIVQYAGQGEIVLRIVERDGRRGIEIVARDEGPGIGNLDMALQVGYSTSGGLGLGLPGTKRLMDEFEIGAPRGLGTTVRVVKWKK